MLHLQLMRFFSCQLYLGFFDLASQFILKIGRNIFNRSTKILNIFSQDQIEQGFIPVSTAQQVVAICCKNLDVASTALHSHFHKCDVKSTAAQVVHQRRFIFLELISAIVDCCSSRLIDYTHYVHTCKRTGLFSCIALGIAEIGRAGNDHILDIFILKLTIFLNPAKNNAGEFDRIIFFSINNIALAIRKVSSSNIPLEELAKPFGIYFSFFLCTIAHNNLPIFHYVNSRCDNILLRFIVGDNFCSARVIQLRNTRIRSTQVNSVNSHCLFLPSIVIQSILLVLSHRSHLRLNSKMHRRHMYRRFL